MLHATLNLFLGWLIPATAVLIALPLGLWLGIRELWQTRDEVEAGRWPLERDDMDDVIVLKLRGGRVTFWTASSAAFGPSDLN
jgi:hypothetical protein